MPVHWCTGTASAPSSLKLCEVDSLQQVHAKRCNVNLEMSELPEMKPVFLLSPLLLAACTSPSTTAYEQPQTAVIPEQFRGTWALDSSACSSSKPYPYIRLEADSYRVPAALYSKEPVRFPVQNVVMDRTNERRLIATFPNADIQGERTEIAIELSKDGKTIRWGEKGAVKIATLHRCG